MRRSVLWLKRVRSYPIENWRHSEALRKWVTAYKNTVINTLGFFIQMFKLRALLGAKSPFFLFSPGSGVTFPWGFEVGVDLCDGFFPLSSFFLPLEELSDPGDFLPSIPFSLGEWWFPLVAAPLSLASSTTRSWSDFSPSLFSVLSLFNFLWSGEPALCLSPGLRELLWKYHNYYNGCCGPRHCSRFRWFWCWKLIYKQLMISDGCGCIGIRSEAKFRANTNYPPYVDEEMVLIETQHTPPTLGCKPPVNL